MEINCLPLGRRRITRSSNEDIIAGVDFLSVFIRNAEERYYPSFSKTTPPFDVIDNIYSEETTTKRPRFSISTLKTTTEATTVSTTTRKPKLSIPTLPTIRKVDITTSESSSNIELRTALPPITNSDVYKYIKSKSTKEKNDKYSKEDTFTEISVHIGQIGTEKSKPNSKNAVSIVEPSAIIANSNKDELSIDEEDPLTIEATEINEEVVSIDKNGANPDYIAQQKRNNREDGSTYQFDYNRNSRTSPNKARSISYSTVIQVPGTDLQKNWKNEPEVILDSEYKSNDYEYKVPEKKNFSSESAAETKDYYVTTKYNPQDYNESIEKNRKTGETWDQKKFEEQQHKLYHTTEKNWGSTEKNWGIQQTTPKVWGTTEKNWGIQQTTPKVWGVQQTTPKVWGVQQTTPKVWGVQQTTPKVWGVQQQPYSVEPQPASKIWGTTEKNWGIQNPNYPKDYNRIYAQPEENYEVDEDVSLLTNGRTHGVQNKNQDFEKPLQIKVGAPPANPNDNQKVGYVVEGRHYKKYRVEERTSDGFIVGEYGVVSNNDGSLRGVRYTADGTINPSVIYDALMKFLSL